MSLDDTNGQPGQIGITDTTGEANRHGFLVRQALARLRTILHVKVIEVHALTKDEPYQWTVDVQPIVRQVDGVGNPSDHGIIYGLPVICYSGGNGAVNVQPKKDDLGIIGVADRDSSAALANKGPANPGSNRRHDLADGIYLGGVGAMNKAPQYVELSDKGVVLRAKSDGDTDRSITAQTDKGPVSIVTKEGPVSVQTSKGPVSVKTGGGTIEMNDGTADWALDGNGNLSFSVATVTITTNRYEILEGGP